MILLIKSFISFEYIFKRKKLMQINLSFLIVIKSDKLSLLTFKIILQKEN